MTKKGLYGKFVLEKADGTPMDEDAEYFVLRLDNDQEAVQAILGWALRSGHDKLFDDLHDKYRPGRVV